MEARTRRIPWHVGILTMSGCGVAEEGAGLSAHQLRGRLPGRGSISEGLGMLTSRIRVASHSVCPDGGKACRKLGGRRWSTDREEDEPWGQTVPGSLP